MIKYRVRKRIIQESAISVSHKGYLARIGKFQQYFNIGEEEKVAEWANKIWHNSGNYPVDRNPSCLVYVITTGGQYILYATYKPIELAVI